MRWPWQALFTLGRCAPLQGGRCTVRPFAEWARDRRAMKHASEDHRTVGDGPPRVCQLNHAGASPPSPGVLERVRDHLDLEQRIGGYAAEATVAEEIEGVYQRISELVSASSPSEIALVESATVAWTRAFYALAQKQQKERPTRNIILVSDAEYAASLVAACQWARDHQWTVLSIPSVATSVEEEDGQSKARSNGVVDAQVFQQMLAGKYSFQDSEGKPTQLDPSRIAMVCITHVPTNSGIVNPVDEIGILLEDYNCSQNNTTPVFYLVDTCQSVGQLEVNVEEMHCHALVATGRKFLRGPRGTGFLYISSTILRDLLPSHVDHFGVPVSKVPHGYLDGDSIQSLLDFSPRLDARRFEFWESNVANRLGLGVAVEYAMAVSIQRIQSECQTLARHLRERLASLPTIRLHHGISSECAIVTFYSTCLDSKVVKERMLGEGFELSVVPATSTPIDSAKMDVPDLVRASISYTNTQEDVDSFLKSLSLILDAATPSS